MVKIEKLNWKNYISSKPDLKNKQDNPIRFWIHYNIFNIFKKFEKILNRSGLVILKDNKKKFILFLNPKAGCTVWTKMFFEHFGCLEEASSYSTWVHDYRAKVFKKRYPISLIDILSPRYTKIKIVRNPYARVVSSYIHVMKYSRDIGISKVVKNIKQVLRVHTPGNISFSQFVEFLSKIDLHTCNGHFAFQSKSFERILRFDHICKLENTPQELIILENKFGLKLNLITKSHHHIKKIISRKNVAHETWKNLESTIPSYEQFYTPELKKKIGEIYKKDIMAYGYTYEDLLTSESTGP